MEQYKESNAMQEGQESREEPGIRYCQAFPVAPLRLGGIFGIGWQLFRRNITAGFLLTLVLLGLAGLVSGLVTAPLLDIAAAAAEGRMGHGPGGFILAGTRTLLLIPLALLISLALTFLLQPMYMGTMYQEMHDRAEGRVKSTGRLFGGAGTGLKKTYTTMLVSLLMSFCLSFVLTMIMSFMLIGAAFAGALGANGFRGALAPVIVAYVLVLAAVLVFSVFLLLLFPVNAAENKRGFGALSRSFRLAGKRFGRCFGVQLLLLVIELAVILVCYVPGVLLLMKNSVSYGAGLFVMLVGITVGTCFLAPYMAAVATALYRDCAARVPEKTPEAGRAANEAPAERDITLPESNGPAEAAEENENDPEEKE